MTKKSQQFVILLIIILLSIIVYFNYFKKISDNKTIIKSQKEKILDQSLNQQKNTNNLVKNLKYNVKFDNSSEYKIFAELSEITYENGIEIVLMTKVIAEIIDKNASSYYISADSAIFNNSTYNTNFEKNIKINYLDNEILSNKLDLNFTENIVIIYDNVIYESLQGSLEADRIKMNLITKNVEISMSNSTKKINIIAN